MKRVLFLGTLAFLVLGLFISAMALAAEDPKQYYAKYLSAADVEKATGLKGITTNHNYTLHFLNAEGKEILQVRFDKAKRFDEETERKDLWTPFAGVGDQAAVAVPGMPYMLAFKKGHHTVIITTTRIEGMKLYLSVEQMKAICKIIESRLPQTDYL